MNFKSPAHYRLLFGKVKHFFEKSAKKMNFFLCIFS